MLKHKKNDGTIDAIYEILNTTGDGNIGDTLTDKDIKYASTLIHTKEKLIEMIETDKWWKY